jgi:hypothetical protein
MARKIKQYNEADLIKLFNLKRHIGNNILPLMQEWLICETTLNTNEQYIFDIILAEAQEKIDGWQEEDLKMRFIAFVIQLANLSNDEKHYQPFFERTLEATIDEHYLKVKTDFMVATGILDAPEIPYFHFQEYKRQTNPYGSPLAQVLEAMLIAQELNQNTKPIYGCYVVGRSWNFMTLEKRTYCISKTYDCTEADELLQIIAILRHFKIILETKLLD